MEEFFSPLEEIKRNTIDIFYMPGEKTLLNFQGPFYYAKIYPSITKGELKVSISNVIEYLPCDDIGKYLFKIAADQLDKIVCWNGIDKFETKETCTFFKNFYQRAKGGEPKWGDIPLTDSHTHWYEFLNSNGYFF
jgi:hypothetical protein